MRMAMSSSPKTVRRFVGVPHAQPMYPQPVTPLRRVTHAEREKPAASRIHVVEEASTNS